MNVIENMYIASLYMLISHDNHGMVPPNQNLFLMRLITHLPHCRWFCRIQSFPCYQTLRRCTFHIRKYRVPKGNWQSKIGNFLCSTCSLRSVKKKKCHQSCPLVIMFCSISRAIFLDFNSSKNDQKIYASKMGQIQKIRLIRGYSMQ